jgi:Bacterial pre-peptidase C-terminal domain
MQGHRFIAVVGPLALMVWLGVQSVMSPAPVQARASAAAAPKPTPCVPPPDLRPPTLIATPQTCVERIRAAATPEPGVEPSRPPAATDPPVSFGLAPAFGDLQSALGNVMGDPVEAVQHGGGSDCDLEQLTTTGLAYWTCAADVSGFVAYIGQRHWALVAGQLFEWLGDSAEMPPDAARFMLPAVTSVACVGPNDSMDNACLLSGSATTAGEIDVPNGNAVYEFDLAERGAAVDLSLTNLPADYDLYVVDPSGSVIAQSVNEGLDPEIINAVLPRGAYFIYVHSDIGRDVAPFSLFLLHLSLEPT